MRVQERYDDDLEAMASVLDGRQTRIWTALPGYVVSFNAEAMTAVVQPTIQGRVTQIDTNTGAATTSFQNLPTLLDCPVQFPAGGGCSLTFPVKPGDECLVVFASRCIDGWWYLGGVQPPMEARMHDLSDGFVLLGFRSKPRALSSVSTTSAQLRSDDGSTYVEINPTGQLVNVEAPQGLTINAGGCQLIMSQNTAQLVADEIVTVGPTRLNNGTRGVAFRGAETTAGDSIAEGSSGVFV